MSEYQKPSELAKEQNAWETHASIGATGKASDIAFPDMGLLLKQDQELEKGSNQSKEDLTTNSTHLLDTPPSTQTQKYVKYTYQGPEKDGTLFRIWKRHKETGRIKISFKTFLDMNTHIDVQRPKKGNQINFPEGTQTITHMGLLQTRLIKDSYRAYIQKVKMDLQNHENYPTLSQAQRNKIDSLGLLPEEQAWIDQKETDTVSIKHIRYILVPNDTLGFIAKKTGLGTKTLRKDNVFSVKGQHQNKTIYSAHPGDWAKLPTDNGQMFLFNFPEWRREAKHGGAQMSDMELEASNPLLPLIKIHPYTLKAVNWKEVAHRFIYENYTQLSRHAKGNQLEVAVEDTKGRSKGVFSYTHQKPANGVSIKQTYVNLESYRKIKQQEDEYNRKQTEKDSKGNANDADKALSGGSVGNMQEFFKILATFLKKEVPRDGSKVSFSVGAFIPMGPSQVYFGVEAKFEVSKSGNNIRLTSKVGLTLRAKIKGIAEAGITFGGYLDAQGPTAYDVLQSYQLAMYYRLRHIASKHMLSGTFWGYVLEGSIILIGGIHAALWNRTGLKLEDRAGLILHSAINLGWGKDADDFSGAESWANGIKSKIKSNSSSFAESGIFIKAYVNLDLKAAKFKAAAEGEFTSGLRIDQKSIEQDEKKGKPDLRSYPTMGRGVHSLSFKTELGWGPGAFALQVKEVKDDATKETQDSEITCLFSFDLMKVKVPGALELQKNSSKLTTLTFLGPVLIGKINQALNQKNANALLPKNTGDAISTMITLNGIDKTMANLKAVGGGVGRVVQLSVKLIPRKSFQPYRGVEIVLLDTLKISFDLNLFKAAYENAQPLTKKHKGKY